MSGPCTGKESGNDYERKNRRGAHPWGVLREVRKGGVTQSVEKTPFLTSPTNDAPVSSFRGHVRRKAKKMGGKKIQNRTVNTHELTNENSFLKEEVHN